MNVKQPGDQQMKRRRARRPAWRVSVQKPLIIAQKHDENRHNALNAPPSSSVVVDRDLLPSRPLTSDADRLSSRFLRCLDDLQIHHLTFPQTIKFIGAFPCYDAAVVALTRLGDNRSPWPESAVNSKLVLRPYTNSVIHLAESLRSLSGHSKDGALFTTATLGLIDAFTLDPTQEEAWTMFKHLAASRAILMSYDEQTDIGRAMIYTLHDIISFIHPCFSGSASPFEGTHWEHAQPLYLGPFCTPQFMKLRQISHRLFVHLPGLVSLFRAFREHPGLASNRDGAFARVEELEGIQDQAAENWLLHHVTISKTTDGRLCTMLPVSFGFRSMEELRVGVYYWQNRLILLRIRILLDERDPKKDTRDLMQQELWLAKNILMSWQQSQEFGPIGTMPLTMGLLIAWAAFKTRPTFNSFPSHILGWWMRNALKRTLTGWIVGPTMTDLNAAAEVLSGGPLTGYMAKMFSSL
ncbi:hypothetical protein LTR86_009303 [Recurvomyces mirabilis]|nr:hypothetical protein LTR86_009303 [Recurvomyces mirabilis]